jgi:hypothetical protein
MAKLTFVQLHNGNIKRISGRFSQDHHANARKSRVDNDARERRFERADKQFLTSTTAAFVADYLEESALRYAAAHLAKAEELRINAMIEATRVANRGRSNVLVLVQRLPCGTARVVPVTVRRKEFRAQACG